MRVLSVTILGLMLAGCGNDVTPYSCICEDDVSGEDLSADNEDCEDSAGLQSEWSDKAANDLADAVEARCCPDGGCICACEADE